MDVSRIYVDTSVFGGCFDPELEVESKRFFDLVRAGRITTLVSDVVVEELERAPDRVRKLIEDLPTEVLERAPVDGDADRLARAYVEWGVVPERSWNDARHVAAASRSRADAIASWNFRDIVSPQRIRGFNAMNLTFGYGLVVILSPHGISRATEELR